MKTKLVRNRWDRLDVPVELADAPEDALTQQQFVGECDMNRIVRDAMRGIPPKFQTRGEPIFGDFSNIPDLATAHDMVVRAQEAFMSLPAALRAEIDNDPLRIDSITMDQFRKYGLTSEFDDSTALDDSSVPTQPAPPAKRPKAGQAAKAGTEPASTDLKGQAKSQGDS